MANKQVKKDVLWLAINAVVGIIPTILLEGIIGIFY